MADRIRSGTEAMALALSGDRLAALQLVIGDHLNEIAPLFKGAVKLTLVVRTPSHPDGSRDVVVTNDDISAAILALSLKEG